MLFEDVGVFKTAASANVIVCFLSVASKATSTRRGHTVLVQGGRRYQLWSRLTSPTLTSPLHEKDWIHQSESKNIQHVCLQFQMEL